MARTRDEAIQQGRGAGRAFFPGRGTRYLVIGHWIPTAGAGEGYWCQGGSRTPEGAGRILDEAQANERGRATFEIVEA